ncbi:AAA family ATPase [Rhodoflexus sp.]
MKDIRFPYGLSNFEQLVSNDYVFVDKTPFIAALENATPFASFLRPRRFGKSLLVSMLSYYYDIRHRDKFDKLFGKYYIGKHPTARANSFRVLNFNFSGINTDTPESSRQGFNFSVKSSVAGFLIHHPIFSEAQQALIMKEEDAEKILSTLFEVYNASERLYLFIDEYDHFTDEILLQSIDSFKSAVSQNGYVRKFYEVIKNATQSGVVDRFFLTGVSPVTLDSLTSGFNIITHLTKDLYFNDMIGFSETEVRGLLQMILADKTKEATITDDLRRYYNGYKFHPESPQNIYNPDMVLYFLKEFYLRQSYPRQMLDPNIMPDYGKIKRLFEVANWQSNVAVLEEILREGQIADAELYQFSFEKPFGRTEFVNFLYYLGNLTIAGENDAGQILFKIPNRVIAELYWQYYAYLLQQRADFKYDEIRVGDILAAMAMGNEKPFFELIERTLKALSNRDFQKFDEKYVKMLMIAYAMQSGIFLIQTERELSGGGYTDIEMLVRPNNTKQHFQYLLEVKYLKSANRAKLKTLQQEAADQLRYYLQNDNFLKSQHKLRALSVVVMKDRVFVSEIPTPDKSA